MFLRTQRKLCLLFIFAVNLTLFRRMSPGVNYGRKEKIPCLEPRSDITLEFVGRTETIQVGLPSAANIFTTQSCAAAAAYIRRFPGTDG